MGAATFDCLVDADGHVLEHPQGMLAHAPARFRDRIWHIEVRQDVPW